MDPSTMNLQEEESLDHHLLGMMMIKMSNIRIQPDRGRKEYGDIPALAESIRTNGLIQPLAVRSTPDVHDNGEPIYELMAGGRRWRALVLAGFPEAPCRIYREDFADEERAVILELEENLQRLQLEWPEEQALLARIDEEHRKTHGEGTGFKDGSGWTVEKTAKAVGQAASTVNEKIKFHKEMSKRPDIAEQVVSLPQKAAVKEFKRIVQAEEAQQAVESGKIEITGEVKLGSCLDLFPEVEANSIDLILTDPPYGLDELAESQSRGQIQSYIDTLRPTDNMDWGSATGLIAELPEHFKRVLKPGSHFFIFCKAQLWGFIQKEFESREGIEVYHTPIVWDKMRTTGPFRGYSFTPSYELIVHGWKHTSEENEKPQRLSSACRDLISCKPVAIGSRVHPFEKPSDLLCQLIKLTTKKGDFVLDPFCGSAATIRAAKLLQRRSLAFEIDNGHYHRALQVISEEQKETQE